MAEDDVTSNLPIKPLSPMERVQVAYLTHLGDAYIISEKLNMPVSEVKQYLKQIRESQNSDIRQLTADNVAMYVIAGIEMRMYHLNKQLASLTGRDQMWRSVCCRKPIEEIPATPEAPAFKRCLGCSRACNVELIDYPTIYRVRNETMRSIREEITLYENTLIKLKIVESPPKFVQNVKQDILVVGGQPQDYLKLGPMEMDRLLGDLKNALLKMDDEIHQTDEEIAKAEKALQEEAQRERSTPIDIGGPPETPGTTPSGEGTQAPGTPEKTV